MGGWLRAIAVDKKMSYLVSTGEMLFYLYGIHVMCVNFMPIILTISTYHVYNIFTNKQVFGITS